MIPLEETLAYFWETSQPLAGFSVSIRPPAIEMPLLKRLGDPAFRLSIGLQPLLQPAFRAVSRQALSSAYENVEEEDG